MAALVFRFCRASIRHESPGSSVVGFSPSQICAAAASMARSGTGRRLGNKQKVFDDFIAAAEWLIREKRTTRDKLAIMGGSNGGLLVGAALTQKPELFKAVVCAVPLLDMVRYHNFQIARLWVPEYGSAEDAAQFKFLYAYSPYHRVKEKTAYPAVLLTSAESDSRVDPMHARKMAARLQKATSSDRPDLLRTETRNVRRLQNSIYVKLFQCRMPDKCAEVRLVFERDSDRR